jgi:hypothetical protein
MKRLLIIAALGLSACQTIGSDTVMVPATQGLIVAHNAYQAAAASATAAITACVSVPTTPPCVALRGKLPQIKALSDKAQGLLDEADSGHDIAQNASQVLNLVGSINSLLGK